MRPRALFVSFFDGDATNLIKSILSFDALDLPLQTISGNIVSFPYDLDTKYYTASVDLCTFDTHEVKRNDLCKSLVEDVQRVEAFVAYFSTNERGSFLQAVKCARFMKESNSNVKILVCDSCLSTDEMSRHEILKWCIENGFELVELHDGDEEEGKDDGDDDDDDAGEDDFRETKGIQRIVEALRCNSWSNMVLKDRSTHMSPYMRKLRDEMAESLTTRDTDKNSTCNNTPSDCKDNTMVEASLEKLNIEVSKVDAGKNNDTEDEDSEDDDYDDGDDPSKYMGCDEKFENLFKNIPQMREEASSLPFEERKKYAENVVKQFWCSIGGDMNEFDED